MSPTTSPASPAAGPHPVAADPDPPGSPARDLPLGSFPRRVPGRAPDGRYWELLTTAAGITAVLDTATVAEAHVWAHDHQITIEFWVDGADLPGALTAHLVGHAFAHPAVRAHRPVLLCIPHRDGALLQHVLRRVDEARTRAAGMTWLVEGTVRDDSPVLAESPPRVGPTPDDGFRPPGGAGASQESVSPAAEPRTTSAELSK